jgi:hypothetical protein
VVDCKNRVFWCGACFGAGDRLILGYLDHASNYLGEFSLPESSSLVEFFETLPWKEIGGGGWTSARES